MDDWTLSSGLIRTCKYIDTHNNGVLGAPVEDLPRLLLIDALCRAPTTTAPAAGLDERWQGRHPCLESTASMMQVPAETQPFNNSSSIGRVEEFPPLLVKICPYHTTATKYGLHVWNTGLEVCTSSGTPGVLLPYSEQLRTPSRILHALKEACRGKTQFGATTSTLPPMVWDLVDVTDHDSGTPNVLGLMLLGNFVCTRSTCTYDYSVVGECEYTC